MVQENHDFVIFFVYLGNIFQKKCIFLLENHITLQKFLNSKVQYCAVYPNLPFVDVSKELLRNNESTSKSKEMRTKWTPSPMSPMPVTTWKNWLRLVPRGNSNKTFVYSFCLSSNRVSAASSP